MQQAGSVFGKVVDWARQHAKLVMYKESERNPSGKTGRKIRYPFSPIMINAMYTMPLIGETVILEWQSDDDGDAMITHICKIDSAGRFFVIRSSGAVNGVRSIQRISEDGCQLIDEARYIVSSYRKDGKT